MTARKYRIGTARQSGFTWLEFSVIAVLLSVFAGSLLTALLYYEELTEQAVVELTVANIRSGLRYQIADRLVQGRTREMGQLLKANPISWLEGPPAGYVGMVRTSDVGSLPKGSWFYDTDRAELGYVPKMSAYLSVESDGPSILRWRVQALRSPSPWQVEGLSLVAVRSYQWF